MLLLSIDQVFGAACRELVTVSDEVHAFLHILESDGFELARKYLH